MIRNESVYRNKYNWNQLYFIFFSLIWLSLTAYAIYNMSGKVPVFTDVGDIIFYYTGFLLYIGVTIGAFGVFFYSLNKLINDPEVIEVEKICLNCKYYYEQDTINKNKEKIKKHYCEGWDEDGEIFGEHNLFDYELKNFKPCEKFKLTRWH